MDQLGPLLGRWHQWRREFSHERKLVRVSPFACVADDDDTRLEHYLMLTIEQEIQRLPQDLQLALQHVARAECMGVEVMFNPHLAGKDLDRLVTRAKRELERKLVVADVL